MTLKELMTTIVIDCPRVEVVVYNKDLDDEVTVFTAPDVDDLASQVDAPDLQPYLSYTVDNISAYREDNAFRVLVSKPTSKLTTRTFQVKDGKTWRTTCTMEGEAALHFLAAELAAKYVRHALYIHCVRRHNNFDGTITYEIYYAKDFGGGRSIYTTDIY